MPLREDREGHLSPSFSSAITMHWRVFQQALLHPGVPRAEDALGGASVKCVYMMGPGL